MCSSHICERLLCIATDQVEDHIDLLSQNLLELRLSIIDNPAGSEGVEVRLIAAACRGNDGGAGRTCLSRLRCWRPTGNYAIEPPQRLMRRRNGYRSPLSCSRPPGGGSTVNLAA